MSFKAIIAIGTLGLLAVGTRIMPGTSPLVVGDSWAGLPSTITTTDGDTYDGVSLIRAEPDGYLVNYNAGGNNVGVAKIKFARLSPELQRQSGYDPNKATEYEAKVANAGEDFAQARLAWQQAKAANERDRLARETREADDAAAAAAERAAAQAQIAQAEASLAQASGFVGSYGMTSRAGGYSVLGIASENHNYVKTGFQPFTGFQASSASSVFGTMAPARGPRK